MASVGVGLRAISHSRQGLPNVSISIICNMPSSQPAAAGVSRSYSIGPASVMSMRLVMMKG